MGRNFATGAGAGQLLLMPPDPRDWLPERHLAWGVLEQVGRMDLAGFEAAYRADGQGGKAYHPAVMCGLLLYCYCKGLRSSRKIEMATFDDVGARVICGGLHPDHASVARFTARHEEAVRGLLPASVAACAREGLVGLDVVAGDGTKLKAPAAMAANVTGEQLEAQIAGLEALIEAGVAQWVAEHLAADDADATAPAPRPAAGADDGGGAGRGGQNRAPKRAAQMLERRKAARVMLAARQAARADKQQDKRAARAAQLAERAARKQAAAGRAQAAAAERAERWRRRQAAAAAEGKKVFGREPAGVEADRDVLRTRQQAARAADAAQAAAAAGPVAPDGRVKVNTTDWTSRVMPLKKGGFDQLFNVQALATAASQVILAIMRHDNPSDVEALHPLLEEGRAVLAAAAVPGPIGKAAFDAGYASDANFTRDAGGTELYVAVAREAVQAGRASGGSQSQPPLPSWEQMTARLDTPEGKAIYKKRGATIEPVFGQLTSRLGRTLHYRGNLADTELHLWAASHNLLKAITARASRAAAVPAAA